MTGWLVTGAGGMLGLDLVAALRRRDEEVAGLARGDLDITDAGGVRAALRRHKPGIVVNCAAWTAVDAAEADEGGALLVNGRGAENVAAACAAAGARLVHVSTDYVFSGDASQPYPEDAAPAPRTAYGRSKLAGEQAVRRLLPESGQVVRTAWMYGAHGQNFVTAMIRLAGERPAVDVVTDQRGQPTWTADVADQIIAIAGSRAGGVYHATSSGETTWFGLARQVFRLLGADPDRVRPATSRACPRPAARPAYSVLGHGRHAAVGIEPIGDWHHALRRAWPALTAGRADSRGGPDSQARPGHRPPDRAKHADAAR